MEQTIQLPVEKKTSAETFYAIVIERLIRGGAPFMVGGTYAIREYADIVRDTKDMDVFCKPSDYPRILQMLQEAGYGVEINDANWLSRAMNGGDYVDVIFGSGNQMVPVDDTWFQHAPTVDIFGYSVRLVPAEELLWSKSYVQDRDRFDGADVLHIIRKRGHILDWNRLLSRMDAHWEVLFAHLLMFRFIYPSERDTVPEWLIQELMSRLERQMATPPPIDRICRGLLLSRSQYQVDIMEWGYRP